MGFGLLLCGYFAVTMMSVGMGTYNFVAYLLGGMICFTATAKLKAYNPRFLWSMVLSVVYVLVGVYGGFALLDTLFLWGVIPTGGVADQVHSLIVTVLDLLFHGTVLWSVIELTDSLGMDKLKVRAIRNAVAMGLYAVGTVIVTAIPAVARFEDMIIPRLLVLYLLICYILNAWMLYSCYQGICPAGEEDGKPRKPSRFAFINKLNDKFDEKAEKALRESLEYQAQKQADKEKKRNNKKKK